MSGGASERLSRLLALVPYLLNRQGIPMEQAAKDAGITVDQLEKDLFLLFVCGLPGHMPDDLIEADWEDGLVYLGNADTIARPLRLGAEEVATLLVGLRLLAGLPGAHDRVGPCRGLAWRRRNGRWRRRTRRPRRRGAAGGPRGGSRRTRAGRRRRTSGRSRRR